MALIELFNCFIYRSLKASHLLISGNGKVILTGLGDAFNCIKGGEMRVKAYELPRMAKCSFPWLSPEVLAQVSFVSNFKV